jgi:hypothetical protein
MPYVSGFLRVRERGHPDNELPGHEGPVDPGYGIDLEHPDQGLPSPPPGVWPPPTASHPIAPLPPGSSTPPGTIWPSPGHPAHPIAPGGPPPTPDQGLPQPPAHPDQGLPSQKFWVVAGIPGYGWRYICVDPSLSVSHPIAPPPAPQPRR